jgi:hypothetical protein
LKPLPNAREVAAAAADGHTATALVSTATTYGPVVRGDYWLHHDWSDDIYHEVIAARFGLGRHAK